MEKARNSGIECIKYLATIAIVMCNVITTLNIDNQYVTVSNYIESDICKTIHLGKYI